MASATLTDQIKSIQTASRHPGVACKLGTILRELDAADAKSLADLLDKTRISASAISRLLAENGHRVGVGSIGYHRRRAFGAGCLCAKPGDN